MDELSHLSPEFRAMWNDNDVYGHGEGLKHMNHPVIGPISVEYSGFAVDGRPDLTMVVFNAATPEDGARLRAIVEDGQAEGK